MDVLKQQGITPTEIRLVGGGARSSLWRQMVADIFDCAVVCPVSSEAGAMGAALQAMWCYLEQKEGGGSLQRITDHFVSLDESTRTQPEMSSVSQYANIYQRYLQLSNLMKPMLEGVS
jgi:sugar (pentulose or hexulose) kinase